MAAWASWPQPCMHPGWTDRNPSATGTCSGLSVSSRSLQSMSTRTPTVGPGLAPTISVMQPVNPPFILSTSSGRSVSERAR